MRSIVVLLCLSLSVAGQSLTWIQHPAGGSEYAVTQNFVSWHAARNDAAYYGSHLVIIETQSENDWIRSALTNVATANNALWIGLTDEVTEGTWVWVDGTVATYTNWAPFEPNGANGSNFAQLYTQLHSLHPGKWDDTGTGASRAAIYERPTFITYAVSMDPSTLAGTVSLTNGEALAPYFMLQSNDPLNGTAPGMGWPFGLHISLPDVAWQLTAGVAGNPLFGGTLDANGAFSMTIPGVGVFLSGQTFWGMGIQQFPTGVYAPSNIASITF